ncbi:putative ATPase [Sphingomonas sp. BE270]|jgi:predicted ATPase|uniref:AAA family ATPase n=1 Tax=unclassified Sphingomonas TaxID=196159 RepID=UPI0009E02D72|nr:MULTISPECIES: AAA family ATPase [unclassified Sphingomonas]MDR6848646.1 putative ATPase [Sphingomonas sp. BE137]MDR7255928.1 putative ATPase [Sphingomonas sp. BE270]
MASILGFRVRNFRALKDITFGQLWNAREKSDPLTPLTAVIGKNGVGKSTLFDAFGFLSDCLRLGVEEACDQHNRGGFDRIRSQGSSDPIEFAIYYREDERSRPITYEVSFDTDNVGRPFVKSERLRQRRANQSRGWPFSFLILNDGKGVAWRGDSFGISLQDENELTLEQLLAKSDEESPDTEVVEMDDIRRLGIATLGSLRQHPRISAFRRFIEGWHLSYFTPDAARSLPLAGPQRHLNVHGDNLGNVVQFMEREHPRKFREVLSAIASKIPGIDAIDTHRTEDGRLLLRFNDASFEDPFFAQQMSDGTLKVFAYLLLLEDPSPPPFLCIEEPENGLYHKLLDALAHEFRTHARSKGRGSQIFLTTHQPYLVDSLGPDEVWVMEKGGDGFSTIRRASDDPLVQNMINEGLPLGGLWYSDYLDVR